MFILQENNDNNNQSIPNLCNIIKYNNSVNSRGMSKIDITIR